MFGAHRMRAIQRVGLCLVLAAMSLTTTPLASARTPVAMNTAPMGPAPLRAPGQTTDAPALPSCDATPGLRVLLIGTPILAIVSVSIRRIRSVSSWFTIALSAAFTTEPRKTDVSRSSSIILVGIVFEENREGNVHFFGLRVCLVGEPVLSNVKALSPALFCFLGVFWLVQCFQHKQSQRHSATFRYRSNLAQRHFP